ncbi:hypothetical protein KGF54_004689 [Candida jiufengensis]|uniref:uncharacterized protein n=1 Tax=Candida jiufengensis TaxID=497108 RepID=UPI00222509A9|nr:uncharacterized protein KGF54_004689 [Candida jiufengensis]KAI5951615.1 hypothetical protein KGF54_004689 [Candida jiufengensis]
MNYNDFNNNTYDDSGNNNNINQFYQNNLSNNNDNNNATNNNNTTGKSESNNFNIINENEYYNNDQFLQLNNIGEFLQQPTPNEFLSEAFTTANPNSTTHQYQSQSRLYNQQFQSGKQHFQQTTQPQQQFQAEQPISFHSQSQDLYFGNFNYNYNHNIDHNNKHSLSTNNYESTMKYLTPDSNSTTNPSTFNSKYQSTIQHNPQSSILPSLKSQQQDKLNSQSQKSQLIRQNEQNKFKSEPESLNTANTSKPFKSTSSRSCDICRNKKIKCDKLKPSCTRCQEKGITCVYTLVLQFKEDVESQGKRFGREGINSHNKITTNEFNKRSRKSYYQLIKNRDQLKFINFFNDDIINFNNKLTPTLQSSIIPPDILSVDYGTLDSNVLNFAIKYYIDFISPILNPTTNNKTITIPTVNNDINNISIESGLNLNILVQLSNQNTSIFYLMLSLGSFYLSKSYNEQKDKQQKQIWLDRAFHFQNLGLNKIKPILDDISTISTQNFKVSDIIIALVLLILFEIANNCNFKWIDYLQICKKIMKLNKINIPTDQGEYNLLKFALEFLYYQDSVGRTACKDDSLYIVQLDDETEQEVNDFLNSRSNSHNNHDLNLVSWMGCDRKLIKIIADITDLSFERFKRTINEKQYLGLCNELLNQLDVLKIDYFDFDELIDFEENNTTNSKINQVISNNGMKEEEFYFLLSNETKRLSTKLYLNCCLLNMTPEDEEVQFLVNKIFKYLKFLIITKNFNWFSTLIWSIFITSSEISCLSNNCETLRYLTLNLLNRLKNLTLSNIEKIIFIIKEIWKKRDLNNSDLHSIGIIDINSRKFKKRKKYLGFENDWEKFVVDEYGIALG